MIARSQLHWMTEAGMFFEKKGPIWDTLHGLDERLQSANIDYVVIGGVALNAYDYPRQTVDVDIVLRQGDFIRFRDGIGEYEKTSGGPRRFRDRQTGVTIDVLIAGELAGHPEKNHSVRFPDPAEKQSHGDIQTVSLARLIELKLVTWRFKDWGDVVELIRRNKLTEEFSNQLNPIVQTAFRECFDQANDPKYGER